MKLQNLKSILESIATAKTGELSSYGMILVNPSAYKIDYDEIEAISIYIDKSKFDIALAKEYAKFSGNEDDAFLTYDEICEASDFDAFCEAVWHWDLF